MAKTVYKNGHRYTFYGAATSKGWAQEMKQDAHFKGWEYALIEPTTTGSYIVWVRGRR